MKEAIRGLLASAGWRLTRYRPANRFDGMEDSLRLLKAQGFAPRVIIDAGSNRGQWATMAGAVFPESAFHLIEPQPQCHQALEGLLLACPHWRLHKVALSAKGTREVRMLGIEDGGGTGAFVLCPEDEFSNGAVLRAPAISLDELFLDQPTAQDRPLLKLDLEGHELAVLQDGKELLRRVEVVLTEFQFFEINGNHRPVFRDYAEFLWGQGFELFDFACLSPRPRDQRLRMGDVIFVKRGSELLRDVGWE